jgi:hypothetical protein
VPVLNEFSRVLIIVDPSRAAGRHSLVLVRAMVTMGTDGLLVEVHPYPEEGMSDGAQPLNLSRFVRMSEYLNSSLRLWQEARQAAPPKPAPSSPPPRGATRSWPCRYAPPIIPFTTSLPEEGKRRKICFCPLCRHYFCCAGLLPLHYGPQHTPHLSCLRNLMPALS